MFVRRTAGTGCRTVPVGSFRPLNHDGIDSHSIERASHPHRDHSLRYQHASFDRWTVGLKFECRSSCRSRPPISSWSYSECRICSAICRRLTISPSCSDRTVRLRERGKLTNREERPEERQNKGIFHTRIIKRKYQQWQWDYCTVDARAANRFAFAVACAAASVAKYVELVPCCWIMD